MEKDLIPLSCYANCIRNIGEKTVSEFNSRKIQASILLRENGNLLGLSITDFSRSKF